MNANRLTALRALLQQKGLDAVVVTKYVNLHYFSGFRGDDTTLVVTKDEALLVTDNRYTEQAEKQAPLFTVVEHHHGLLKKTAELLLKLGCQRVGFEGRAIVYADYAALKGWLTGVDFSVSLDLDALRQIKEDLFFDSVRTLLKEILPEIEMRRIPMSDDVFHTCYTITDWAHLQGVNNGLWGAWYKGRLVALMNSSDLHCGWVGFHFSQRQRTFALKMAANIYVYSMFH